MNILNRYSVGVCLVGERMQEKEGNYSFEGNAIAILGFTASTGRNGECAIWVVCIGCGSNGRIWQWHFRVSSEL